MKKEKFSLEAFFPKTNLAPSEVTLESAADREIIFLGAMKEQCTPDEYQRLVTDNQAQLKLFGLIRSDDEIVADEEAATEAVKRIVVQIDSRSRFSAQVKRASLRLAKNNEDPLYTKYVKYRTLMIDARQKMYDKYATKGKKEARRALTNNRNAASGIPGEKGKEIVNKLDSAINQTKKD